MRRWSFLFAAAGTLVWSNLALAAAPITDTSGNASNPARLQRKEAMVTSKKPGKASQSSSTMNKAKANPGAFKITENESPLPRDRVFLSYDYFDHMSAPQYFVGADVAGAFQQTNFLVAPPFNVNGSGAMGGVFGGVLIPVPNTNVLMGPRIGWQGGNINGTIVAPPASPFTYTVRTNSVFYQDAMFKVLFPQLYNLIPHAPLPAAAPLTYPPNFLFPFITASVGVAEVHTDVKGTLGAFQVGAGDYRPGVTFTTGVGVPVGFVGDGVAAEVFVQWRGTMSTASVNIPAPVANTYWINGVDFGVQFRY
jgi:hypothetical protein